VVAVLLAPVLAAACGVPTHTEVRVDGPGLQADRLAARGEVGPAGPTEATDEDDLVDLFLQAAAGQLATAPERLVEFIHPDDRDEWEPGTTVTVVQQDGAPETDRNGRVDIRARQVGVLTEAGYIEPPASDELLTFTFQVVDADTDGEPSARDFVRRLYIRDPPQIMLMSEEALRSYYLPTPVYFWDSGDGDSLVPDLRWLPRTLPAEQRPDQLVRWLVEGPSPWLASEVAALPDGTELRDRVVPAGDRVPVNLTAAAADADLGRLGIQVQWTLHAATASTQIELSVAEQLEVIDSTYRHANRAAAPRPPRYAVVDGVVRQLRGDPVQRVAALPEEVNTGVETAAVTRDGEAAALVRLEADGRRRLTVHTAGGDDSPVSRVAAAMSRPVWLDAAARIGLVVADGRLLRFTPDRITEVKVPSLDDTLSAVAAAADGRRLALVAGGRLYVVPVRRDGGAVTAPPRLLPTTGGQITHVGFAGELRLVYADAGEDRVTLYQVTVDGAIETYEMDVRTAGLTHLVALPTSPWDESGGLVMYEVDGQSYVRPLRDPLQGAEPPIEQITIDAVLGAPEDAGTAPRAPFFLE
jgi:hypothetical protein